MYCTKCGAQMSDAETVCPNCGYEEKIKRKKKTWIVLLLISIVLVSALVVSVVLGAILYGLGVLDFKKRENNAQYKDSYTVSVSKAQKKADVVVATVNGIELTNGKLQMYYAMEVVNFITEHYYELSTYGLKTDVPLDEQYYDAKNGVTWQQKFLDGALNAWHTYAAINAKAAEENYVLSSQMQQTLAELPESLEKLAKEAGYADAQTMIQQDYGQACSKELFIACMSDYYKAIDYIENKYSTDAPTREEAEIYFTENAMLMSLYGITKDMGMCVNVRHILLTPADEKNEDGTYSDADWESCRERAQTLLDSWVCANGTEADFAALAGEHSKDPGSVSNGGLYMYVTEGTMVDEFNDWIFDESRENGDYGLIKTVLGYHLMYFVGEEELWFAQVSSMIISDVYDAIDAFVSQTKTQMTIQTTYKKIVLCAVDMNNII